MKSLLRIGPLSNNATGCSSPFPRMEVPQLLWTLSQCLTTPYTQKVKKSYYGISLVATCVHYTRSAQPIAQVIGCFWASSAAKQLFKIRLKIQTCFWDYIIQEQRGSAVQSTRAVEGKGWSSFRQLSLCQDLSHSINMVAFSDRNSKDQQLSWEWQKIIKTSAQERSSWLNLI